MSISSLSSVDSGPQFMYSNIFGEICHSVQNIAIQAKEFLFHQYADARMFVTAGVCLYRGTLIGDIVRRTARFNNTLNDPQATAIEIKNVFEALSPQVKDLFFYTTSSYIPSIETETDPSRQTQLREEISRELGKVLSFHRILYAVDGLYKVFSRLGTDSIPIFQWLRRPLSQSFGEQAVSSASIGATTSQFDLDIPNTVPYVQNAIPQEIQNKSNEIDTLQNRFRGAIPQEFEDPVMKDFMKVPVFDASHPAVQSRLAALRGGGADVLRDHRTQRHLLDKDSLEGHIAAGHSWAPAKCPQCRHPEHGGIKREYLRIDTSLQDEILAFLRNNTRA